MAVLVLGDSLLGLPGPGPGRPAGAQDGALPRIVHVTAPRRLPAGAPGELSLAFVAPRADVVAVTLTIEALDGPLWPRGTSQREVSLVAAAYGRESGLVTLPLRLAAPGRHRLSVALITEAREVTDPVAVEIDVGP